MDYPKITLEAARVNAHLKQKEAAKKLGIAPVTLASYEKGKITPRLDMLEKISELYRFPAALISFPTH